jgi:hypothetical protein
MRAGAEHDVVSFQADQFRDGQAGLQRDQEERAIPTANPGLDVGDRQQGLDLRGREKLDHFALVAAAGHCEESLTEQGMRRFAERHILGKRVDRRDPRISGAAAPAAGAFEVIEEVADERRCEVVDRQGRRRAAEPILTTERYGNQRLEALQAAVERLEGGKTFDPKTKAADNLSAEAVSRDSAKAEVSRILQVPAEQRFADGEDPADENRRSH